MFCLSAVDDVDGDESEKESTDRQDEDTGQIVQDQQRYGVINNLEDRVQVHDLGLPDL